MKRNDKEAKRKRQKRALERTKNRLEYLKNTGWCGRYQYNECESQITVLNKKLGGLNEH